MPSARSAQSARPTPRRATPPRRVALRSSVVRLRWERMGRIALLVVLVAVVAVYAEHALSYLSTRAESVHQHAVVGQLARQNRSLRALRTSLNEPATIVRRARALGMVRPGEQPYDITGRSGG